MYTAHEVARAFLAFCAENGDLLTNLKLQRILYYAQGWHLGVYDSVLFPDAIEAWIHGPVIPSVYREYTSAGWDAIPLSTIPVIGTFDAKRAEHVRDVWEAYGDYSANTLEEMIFSEPPWREARAGLDPAVPSNNVIDVETMRRFFREKAAHVEEAVSA